MEGGAGGIPKTMAKCRCVTCVLYDLPCSWTQLHIERKRASEGLELFFFSWGKRGKTPRKKEIIKWRVPRRVVVLGLDANRREFILNAEASATVYSIFSRHWHCSGPSIAIRPSIPKSWIPNKVPYRDVTNACSQSSTYLRLFHDGSDNTALLSWFLLRIRSVRILDTIVCSGSLVWLFSPAWDAVKITLQEVGFICPFVVIDPTDLGATTAVSRNLLQD